MSPTVSSVLREWVMALPWKQQSILVSGLRGPDHALLPAIKQVSKWLRAVSQNNADPSKPYMNNIELPQLSALEKEIEHSPAHFVHHFMDALAVVAYGHPDDSLRRIAYGIHYYIAEEIFHLIPEPPEVFTWRHRDKPDGEDDAPRKPMEDRPWVHAMLPAEYRHDHAQFVGDRKRYVSPDESDAAWHDASTAPKTGEHILVTTLGTGGFRICGGKTQDRCEVVHYWRPHGEEGFYLSNGASAPIDDRPIEFSHWMPLPVAAL